MDDAGVGLQHLGAKRRSVGHADCGEAHLGQKADPAGNEATATKLTPSIHTCFIMCVLHLKTTSGKGQLRHAAPDIFGRVALDFQKEFMDRMNWVDSQYDILQYEILYVGGSPCKIKILESPKRSV